MKGRSLKFTESVACWDAAKQSEIKSEDFCQSANTTTSEPFFSFGKANMEEEPQPEPDPGQVVQPSDGGPWDKSGRVVFNLSSTRQPGAVHTVSCVTSRSPEQINTSPPWLSRTIFTSVVAPARIPGSNNASQSSQSCRERSRLSAEAEPDWPQEILSGKRVKPRGVTYWMQSISA